MPRYIDVESETFLKEMRGKQDAVKDLIKESDGEEKTWTARDHWQSVYGSFVEMALTLKAQTITDVIPIDSLAVWLAGYHVSPPEYALKETGAYCEIDPDGVVYTPNQIATAWAYHLRKLVESGLMETGVNE